MRTWWCLVLLACKSTPDKAAPPAPVPVPIDAAVVRSWPALGTDLAVIRDKEVLLWTPSSLPDAAPAVIALSSRLVQPTWAGDHRLYGLAVSGAPDPIDALIEDEKKERTALVVDTTGAREIPIPMKKMTKAEAAELGFPLRSELVAYDDNSVWFFRCWGPKYRPKSAHCGTVRRTRLDGPETADSSSKARAERPSPAIAAPAGWNIVIADGTPTVTCPGTTKQLPNDHWEPYDEARWLSHAPPLYVLATQSTHTLFRGCDDKGEPTRVAVGNGYYAFRDGPTWKLARDGVIVRDLGQANAVLFGP